MKLRNLRYWRPWDWWLHRQDRKGDIATLIIKDPDAQKDVGEDIRLRVVRGPMRRARLRVDASRVGAAWNVLRGRKVVFRLGRLDLLRDLDGAWVYGTTAYLQSGDVGVRNCHFYGGEDSEQ